MAILDSPQPLLLDQLKARGRACSPMHEALHCMIRHIKGKIWRLHKVGCYSSLWPFQLDLVIPTLHPLSWQEKYLSRSGSSLSKLFAFCYRLLSSVCVDTPYRFLLLTMRRSIYLRYVFAPPAEQ